MRARSTSGIFQCRAFLSSRTWRFVHLTICSPESDGHREPHCTPQDSAPKYRKQRDSISSGRGITHILALRALHDIVDFKHSAAAMLATLAICLVVAACAHYLFEVPVTSLLKRR